MSTIPDSFSQSELEEMMKHAPKDNAGKKEAISEAPYNGHTRKALVASVRAAIHELDETYACHPMVMKLLIAECLRDLIECHTNFGVTQFEEGDPNSGIAWLRDGGKLQAALSNVLDVDLPDDFLYKR